MFFLDPFARDLLKNPSLSLHNCGTQIPKNNWNNIFDFISQNLKQDFSIKQKKTYEYAFGNFKSVSQTKENILKII